MKTYKFIFALLINITTSVTGQVSTQIDQPEGDFSRSLEGIEWIVIESKETIVLEATDSNNLIIPGYNEIGNDIQLVENTKDNRSGYFIFLRGNNLIIRDLRNRNVSTTLYLPKDQNIRIKSLGLHNIYVSNFTGEIDATAVKTGHITIKESIGPIVLNTNTGNIRVYFENTKLASPISALSTSGKILVVLQKNTKATVDLESGTTEIESDFKIRGRSIKSVGEKIQGTINGGGIKIQLSSTLSKISLKIHE